MEIIERKDRHRDGVAIGCMERTTGRSQTGKQERSGQKRVFHDDRKFKQGTRPAAPAEALTRQSYTFLTGCPLLAAEKTTMASRSSKKSETNEAPLSIPSSILDCNGAIAHISPSVSFSMEKSSHGPKTAARKRHFSVIQRSFALMHWAKVHPFTL